MDTIPTFRLPGFLVALRRAGLSAGGASVIEAPLDSARLAPAPGLGEALRDVPLIQIRTNSRGEDQPALRGGGSRQVAVLLDGVPLALGSDHRTDLSLVPLQGVTRLTLHRGLSSLLFGPNVLGGVVELALAGGEPPPSAGSDRGAGPSGASGGAGGGWDSSGAWRLDADGSARLDGDRLAWRMQGGLGIRRSPGYRLPSGVGGDPGLDPDLVHGGDGLRLKSDLDRVQGCVSLRTEGRDRGWAALSLLGHSTERGVPPEAHTASPRFWRYPGQDEVVVTVSGGTELDPRGTNPLALSAALGVRAGVTELDAFEDARYLAPVSRQREEDRTTSVRLTARRGRDEGVTLRGSATVADVRHGEGPPGEPVDRFQQRLWSVGGELEALLAPVGASMTPRLGVGLVLDGAGTRGAGPGSRRGVCTPGGAGPASRPCWGPRERSSSTPR